MTLFPQMTSVMTSWLTFLLLLTSSVQAAEMQFTSSPPEVHSPVTDTLDMRCSIGDDVINMVATSATTTTEEPGLVGKRDVGGSLNQETTTVGSDKRGISADEVIKHVASMTISRDDVPIATISTFTSAVVESDLDKANIKVRGDVSSDKGELGYLQLVWDFPNDSQTGEYKCSAVAITELGHFVTFTKTLTVQKSSINLEDLIREVRDLKQIVTAQNVTDYEHKALIANETSKLQSTIHLQQTAIDQLQSETTSQKTTIDQLKSKTTSQQTNIDQLQSKTASQERELSSLKMDMQESKHVEQGMVNCGSSNNWPAGSGTVTHNNLDGYRPTGRENRVKGSFQRKFSSPPVVFVSPSYLVVGSDHHVWYGIKVVDVTTDGFTVRCDTRDGSGTLLETLEVDWVAIPV